MTVAAVTVTEGSDAEFAVELGAASGREVTVSYATADDTAQQPGDYARATGTLTFSPGEPLRQTITVTTVDDELDEPDEAFTLTLSGAGNATLSGGGSTLEVTGTITDGDEPPQLTVAAVTVTEGSDAEFAVELGAASGREVTVSYATADDTAQQPGDYARTTGTLTFSPGEPLRQTITVATVDDELDEADEAFTLTLSGAGNATLSGGGSTLEVTGTITDGDEPPQLTVAAVTVTEGSDAEFAVELGAASGREVTVSYATADDTAQQPGDYARATGTLTFSPGEPLRQTITVTTVDDELDEPDEAFTLTLSGAGNATLSGGASTLAVTGTITDGDDPPQLTVAAVTVTEGSDAEFAVELGAASGREVTVSYATADDTAQQPGDYARATGTLTFTPWRAVEADDHGDDGGRRTGRSG